MTWFINLLASIFHWDIPSTDNLTEVQIEPPPEAPVSPVVPSIEPIPPPGAKKSMLDLFCTAIRDFEGAPGDLNYRNGNPGNFRCSPVGYASIYGDVKCVGGFAVFPSYDLGWKYLENSVLYRAKAHPTWTILDFFEQYAPPGDNNPTLKYATFVAGKCGVSVDTTLQTLFG